MTDIHSAFLAENRSIRALTLPYYKHLFFALVDFKCRISRPYLFSCYLKFKSTAVTVAEPYITAGQVTPL